MMKKILKYTLRKLKSDLEHELSINELFKEKDNYNYRNGFYELVMGQRRKNKQKIISFDNFCKQFIEKSDNKIKEWKEMMQVVKTKLKNK